MSDLEMNQTELLENATETVNQVVESMPKDLTPEEERVYLLNTGRSLGRACMIIQEMLATKKNITLN